MSVAGDAMVIYIDLNCSHFNGYIIIEAYMS